MNGESWRPVVGYEGLYEVSDHGRVRSITREVTYKTGRSCAIKGRLRALTPDAQGYLHVSLSRSGVVKHFYVHRLVGEQFVPNPTGLPEINHEDRDKSNNTSGNLTWVTRLGNVEHARKSGLYGGRSNPNFRQKLNPDQVSLIVLKWGLGKTHEQLALEFGVCRQTVTDIISGRIWRSHV